MDEMNQDRENNGQNTIHEGVGEKPAQNPTEKERKPRREDDFFVQAMPIILLALGAFFGICVYTATPVGVVGEFFHYALFGIFGNAAFGLPPLLIYGAIFFKKDYAAHTVLRKLLFSLFGLLLVAVMFYTFGVPEADKAAFASFFRMGVDKIGGGIFGNYIGFALNYTVSMTGTVILSVLFLILFGMVFFGITPSKVFASLRAKLSALAKARKEKRLRYAEEKERLLLEKKNEAERRAASAFYGESLPTGGDAPALPKAERGALPTSDKAPDPFLFPAGGGRRTFYDAEADNSVFEEEKRPEEPTPTYTGTSTHTFQAVKDPFFSMDDESTAPYVEEREEEAAPSPVPPTEKKPTRERSYAFSFVEEEENEFPPVQIVQDSDIPEADLVSEADTLEVADVSIPAFDRPFAELDAEDGDESEGIDLVSTPVSPVKPSAPVVEKPTEPEKPRVQIVDAHKIEHSGIESFADAPSVADKAAPAYTFPPLSLLHDEDKTSSQDSAEEIERRGEILLKTLASFNVGAKISQVSRGPRLTRYELVPDEGVRIKSIENLVNEIAMNLEALSVRIEAPIPGKAAVGVEVPNLKYSAVRLRGLLDTEAFRSAPGKTTVCLGVDVVGEPVFADLDKMPHLLVAGATGMGKSVCINSILISLLYKARPNEVKLILIDPKKVEFKSYSDIPHLLVPIVTDAQKAAGALSWAVNEMERRYDIIEEAGVRNLKAYNKYLETHPEGERLPQIVIIIDELHDLMMQAPDAVEDSICRIAQKARAAGILLIIGTQRPSVNVITGVIKANIPSRIAFHVAAQVDSRTILDSVGAEKLLNDGDMLFLCPGMRMLKPKRVQGAFLDDDEVNRVAEFLRTHSDSVEYSEEIMADMERESEKCNKEKRGAVDNIPMGDGADSEDELFYRAVEVALDNGKISTSLLQRKLSLGFGKAARMIDRMQEMGIVSEPNGQKPRDVLISYDDYKRMRLREDE
ncbi:MAG: DNA translocase FtsK [Clostridia bacterium]|nr:DNA translocase FtsK [Clostridia bacterium]